MELRSWKGFCLCAMGGTFPPDAQEADELFSPLVFLVDRDPSRSRGWFRIDTIDALFEPEDCAVLLPPERRAAPEDLRDFVAKNGATVGTGAGQTNRIWATEQAIEHGGDNTVGSVMASDAFFPFDDCVEAAGKAGITAIAHPGGSVNDNLSVAKADEYGIAMIMTHRRHFKH